MEQSESASAAVAAADVAAVGIRRIDLSGLASASSPFGTHVELFAARLGQRTGKTEGRGQRGGSPEQRIEKTNLEPKFGADRLCGKTCETG